ncbi:MAG: hypothetical protein J0H55_05050 [Chitinophagaceae bacterium]|nr:hypothetical protein [Chitinophagaceae bacterium]
MFDLKINNIWLKKILSYAERLFQEDLGRDLVCKKNNEIEIVQCKYRANHKTIHEKHINQLQD